MNWGPGDRFRAACVSLCGCGHLRPAPGTWGSAFAVAVFLAAWLLAAPLAARWFVELILGLGVVAATAGTIALGRWATVRYASSDPRCVVLDEFAGQWVSLLALPLGLGAGPAALATAAGTQFVLFRIMDVIKPPPGRWLERLPMGWGIVLDDLAAGLYANIVGQVLLRFTPLAGVLAGGA